jgi:hypothetical protein
LTAATLPPHGSGYAPGFADGPARRQHCATIKDVDVVVRLEAFGGEHATGALEIGVDLANRVLRIIRQQRHIDG